MPPANIRLTPPSSFTPIFVPATEADLALIAPRLRPEIADECRAASGMEPLASLISDIDRTRVLHGKNGSPCAAVSVTGVSPTACALWVAVCEGLQRRAPGFVPAFAKLCMELHSEYKAIHCLTDARNIPTATLLTNCGFVFCLRAEQFGKEQRPFNLYASKSTCANPYQ